jgi:hypothetical protein
MTEDELIQRVEDAWPRQLFYVVFTDAGRPQWWDRWLMPGFQHVYVLVWDGACWLLVDPQLSHVRVTILDQFEPEPPTVWLRVPGATIIEARPEVVEGRVRHPWIFGLLTCVEGVKAVLGIRRPWILTPWQLARHLRRQQWVS